MHAAQLHCGNRWLMATKDKLVTMQRIAEAAWNVPWWWQNIPRIVHWEQDCQQRRGPQNVIDSSNVCGYWSTRSEWATVNCMPEGIRRAGVSERIKRLCECFWPPCNSRVPIRSHVSGTVPVLWVLNSCVLVTHKIRFGMPIVPFFAPPHKSMTFWHGVRTFCLSIGRRNLWVWDEGRHQPATERKEYQRERKIWKYWL